MDTATPSVARVTDQRCSMQHTTPGQLFGRGNVLQRLPTLLLFFLLLAFVVVRLSKYYM